MTRVLIKDGVIQFRSIYGNKMQIVPEGMTADDCDCCNVVDCELCPESEGGPFRTGTVTVDISGFPDVLYETLQHGFGQRTDRTLEGVSGINGQYILELDPETCTFSKTVVIPITVTEKLYSNVFSEDNCEMTANPEVTVYDSQISASLAPDFFEYIWGSFDFILSGILTVCDGPKTRSAAFSRTACHGSASFTYSFTWTFNGVP